MDETTPLPSRLEQCQIASGVRLAPHRFKKGNAGKAKGTIDKRRRLGQEAAAALEAGAWSQIERLLTSSSWRARLESAKVVLSYSLGMPRQMLTIAGGFGDLGKELAAALAEARARRAVLDVVVPVAGLLDAAEANPAAPGADVTVLDAEVVKEGNPCP